jgi:CDP-diacylglycerol--glycerol-3-phosphate 3-phosphatidyltransferase
MTAAESESGVAPVPATPARPDDPVRRVRRRSLREDAVNLPNLLTMLRVVLIPVALFLIVEGTPTANFWAAMVYAVSAVTDFLDGWLARRMGLESVLGKFLDPLADKLLVVSSLVAMVAMARVPAWVVILIVARELSITSLRSAKASRSARARVGRRRPRSRWSRSSC